MINRYLQRFLLVLPSIIFVGSNFSVVEASSNNNSQVSNQVFIPYIEGIKKQLVPGLLFRLPSEIPTLDSSTVTQNNYRVQVSPSLVNAGMTVSIFNCNLDSPACLLGSFSVNSPKSLGSQEEFTNHKNNGKLININNKIPAYLLNAKKEASENKSTSASQFSSIMWEQDGLISRIRIRDENSEEISENLLTIASSMATATPINYVDNQNRTATSVKPVQPIKLIEPVENGKEEISTKPEITKPIDLINSKPIINIDNTPDVKLEENIKIPIRLVKITGNSALTQEQINPVIEKFEGKYFERLEWQKQHEKIVNNINQLYQEKGFIASAESEGNKDINDGIIKIKVTESRIAEITVQDTNKVKVPKKLESYILSRLQVSKGEPVNAIKIEEKLRLLSKDPLFKDIKGNLGYNLETQDADKILVVTVEEAPALTTSVRVDNYSPESVGSEKMTVGINYRNLIGVGDKISANYIRTFTGGINLFDVAYEVPINSMDGKLQVRTIFNLTKITQSPFDELNIRGEKQIYEVFYRQPILKSSQEELALSLGFSYDNGRTFVFDKPTAFGLGPDKEGLTRTSAISFRQDYTNPDNLGLWYLESEFKIGTGLFNPTSNKEPVPDGYFFSWKGEVQRFQQLSKNNLLIVRANLQLTPDGLLPSQQFVIGGGDNVRGYRQNARSGDNGFYFSIEDRISLNSQLKIAPFLDVGKVWNASQNPNELAKQTLLIGSGLGVIWQPLSNLTLRLDYAFPFINLDDKGSNLQDNGWYFNLNYQP